MDILHYRSYTDANEFAVPQIIKSLKIKIRGLSDRLEIPNQCYSSSHFYYPRYRQLLVQEFSLCYNHDKT
jgi:hypothetical protein